MLNLRLVCNCDASSLFLCCDLSRCRCSLTSSLPFSLSFPLSPVSLSISLCLSPHVPPPTAHLFSFFPPSLQSLPVPPSDPPTQELSVSNKQINYLWAEPWVWLAPFTPSAFNLGFCRANRRGIFEDTSFLLVFVFCLISTARHLKSHVLIIACLTFEFNTARYQMRMWFILKSVFLQYE